jgi:hypothetical protein
LILRGQGNERGPNLSPTGICIPLGKQPFEGNREWSVRKDDPCIHQEILERLRVMALPEFVV